MPKCSDVMTKEPSCCVASSFVIDAARIMRDENVGPVPIVTDDASMRLVGIITDRDLAIKVVAENRDPQSTRIEEVMSRDLVVCQPDDDLQKAIDQMTQSQVRRIPVVDDQKRIVGIIAQADIAMHTSDNQTGHVVEEISKP